MSLMTFGFASAQLTTGEPTSKTIMIGNRPQAGSFGAYIGATGQMFSDLADSDIEFQSLPLLNLKYMKTDNTELRLGIELYRKSENASSKGDTNDSKYNYHHLKTENRLYPGIAYHFNSSNLLDVYVGAEALIGWSRRNYQTTNSDNETLSGEGSMTAFQLGAGAFIGFQAFIGDLPVALGLEYGLHGYGNYNQKFKRKTSNGDVYSINQDEFEHMPNISGEKVSASKNQLGQQVRVTLSYYFDL